MLKSKIARLVAGGDHLEVTVPTLLTLGYDSSGRPIRATPYEAAWIDAFADACETRCPEPFTPVIVQGPWQSLNGGGAAASKGSHDQAGGLDYRTRDRSKVQKQFMLREARRMAGAFYLRTAPPFEEEHGHVVIGGASPKAPLTAAQWQEYIDGGDGLVGNVPDNRWRPTPLVATWRPAPAPTPNITAALSSTGEARKRALRKVANRGSKRARAAAKTWLAVILKREELAAKVSKARGELKGEQVR